MTQLYFFSGRTLKVAGSVDLDQNLVLLVHESDSLQE